MPQTKQRSILDSTVRFVHEDILSGRYRAGERLVESELVTRFGVSRSTVRAALLSLSARGLVNLAPTLGATVAECSYEDALELYRLRSRVESMLIGRFTARATVPHLLELEDAIEQFASTASSSDNLRRIHRTRDAFYEVFFDGAESPTIEQAVRFEYGRLAAFRGANLPVDHELERIRTSARTVTSMLPIIRRRDAETARRFCERTLTEDGAATLRYLSPAG